MKVCYRCKFNKEDSEFYKTQKSQWCRLCLTEVSQAALRFLKEEILHRLGNRCQGPHCNWVNEDGTRGCTRKELLHLDHVSNDGKERKDGYKTNTTGYYKKILSLSPEELSANFQILCPNCNWLKRLEDLARSNEAKKQHSERFGQASELPLKEKPCAWCDKAIQPDRISHRFCSRSCKAMEWLDRHPEARDKRNEWFRNRYHLSKAENPETVQNI